MALQTQHLEIAFNSGADESQEDYATSSPISALVDFEYRKDAGLRKRYGWAPKGDLDVGLGAAALVPAGTSLGVLGRNTLTGVGANGIDADASPRTQHTARITSERFANVVDSADLLDCDTAYCTDGRVCVVATRYDGSAYSVLISVFDTNGGLLYKEVVTSARRARVLAQGASRFNVYYTSTSSNVINVRSIIGDPTQGGTQSTTSSLVSNHATFKAYDVCNGSGTDAYLVYNIVTTGRMQVAKISAACAVSASYDTALTTMDYPSIAYHPTSGHVRIAYGARSTTDGYILTVNGTPSATIAGPTAVVTGTRAVTRTGCCALLSSPDNPFVSLFETSGAFLVHTYANADTDTHAGGVTAAFYNIALDVAPFALASGRFDTSTGDDRVYAGFLPGSRVTFGDTSGDIQTSMLGMLSLGGYGTTLTSGVTFSPRSFGPVVPLVSDGAATLPTDATAGRIVAGSGSLRYAAVPYIFDQADGSEHAAVLVLRLNTAPSPEPLASFGGATYVGGSMLRFFDGQRLGEATSAWAPADLVPTTVGAGLSPAAGTYSYAAYAEWTDGNGDAHRSPVSQAISLVHAGGSVSVVARFNAPSILDTTNGTQKWVLRLYRTLTGGATFRFVASKEISAADATVTITDTSSDLTISDHEILYTDGGIMQAEAPPALRSLVEHRGRLWGISAQDPHAIHPSKVKEEAISVEFNADLVQRVDATSPPLALASQDDKLLIFTGTDTYAIVGDGPDSTGVASGSASWSPAEVVCPGLGATGPMAALSTPLGTIVHSPSGFKLLGRDLSPADIGGALLDSAPGTTSVLRAVNFPSRQQAWFLMANGKVIVFDYARSHLRWSRFTVKNGTEVPVDIANVAGTPYVLSDAGSLYSLSTSAHDDDGVFVTAGLITGWIRPDQLLGEVRFRVLHLYGNRDTHSGWSVTIGTQGGEPQSHFFPTYNEAAVWTATELAIQTPAHVRHRLAHQRAHALRLNMVQVAGDAVDSAGFEPLGIGLEYGTHYKPGKTPASSNPG